MKFSYVINEFDSLFSISYDHVIWLLYFSFYVHKLERGRLEEKEERVFLFGNKTYVLFFSPLQLFNRRTTSHTYIYIYIFSLQ
jgi:hypothetical protein